MSVLSNVLNALWRRKQAVTVIGLIVVFGNIIAAVFFNGVDMIYRGETITSDVLNLTIYSFTPAGALAVICFALFLEAYKIGWEKSSFNKIFSADNVSSKTNIFYTTLYASNIITVFGFLFTLGIAYYVGAEIRTNLNLNLLADSSAFVSIPILFLSNSLLFYVLHKINHTRFLWELHKTHHSATHMDIINNFRSHPVDAGLKASLFALPVAMLGISPTEIIISSILSGFLVLMQHSDMDWDMPFVEKYLFIGAAGHRLHHSMDIRHQGKNLGYVVLWDWLFGTLHREDDAKVTIGIDDDPYHVQNSGRMTTELWGIYAATLKVLAAETVKTLSLNSGQRD